MGQWCRGANVCICLRSQDIKKDDSKLSLPTPDPEIDISELDIDENDPTYAEYRSIIDKFDVRFQVRSHTPILIHMAILQPLL